MWEGLPLSRHPIFSSKSVLLFLPESLTEAQRAPDACAGQPGPGEMSPSPHPSAISTWHPQPGRGLLLTPWHGYQPCRALLSCQNWSPGAAGRAGQGRVVLLVRVLLSEAWSLSRSPSPVPSPSPLVCLWRALTNPRRESLCYHQVNCIWRWACASRGLQTSTAAAVITDTRAGCYEHLHTPVTLPAPRGLSTQPTARIAASTRARPSSCLHFHCLA